MSQIQRHYDDLLAIHYSWMGGMPFAEKVAEQRALLVDLGLRDGDKGLAIDLGCGPGYQAMALSELGYDIVLALDTSQTLLDELTAASEGRPITPLLADMRSFSTFVGEAGAGAIVCMGDTLTHLESRSDVSKLLGDAYETLRPDGRLVLTFRDFSAELEDTDRFIPVRADDQRIMMCAMIYERDHVVVTDLVHVRSDDGWTLHKSSYRKLRLEPSSVAKELQQLGFSVEVDKPVNRMHAMVARKK